MLAHDIGFVTSSYESKIIHPIVNKAINIRNTLWVNGFCKKILELIYTESVRMLSD